VIPPTLNGISIRRGLGRNTWGPPIPFGPDGWLFRHKHESGQIIVTCSVIDGTEWVHASIAFAERMPTYAEIKNMHWAAFFDGYAYEVFAPEADHVNIHDYARHLWGRRDGKPMLPDFTMGTGSI
jgi:hypothetical protein